MKNILSALLVPLTALSLLSAIAPVSAQAQTSTASCYTFTRNLGEGRPISAQEGTALGQDLSSAGVWNSGTAITLYTDAVASAVSGFQEKYAAQILTPNGLSYGTGFVGVSTRTQLNSLYGCSSTSSNTGYSNTGNGQAFQCPAGYTCAPVNRIPVTFTCPAGYTCSPSNPVTTPTPAVPTCPTGYTCTYSPGSPQNGNCPAGYVCSIPPVTTTCPTGYTCSSASGQNPTTPTLASISLTTATPGSWITLSGSGFSSVSSAVTFSGNGVNQDVSPNSVSTNSISLAIPNDLPLGTYNVAVTNLGNFTRNTSNPISLTIASQVSTSCPAGYTCTTPGSPTAPSCPSGYICTPPGSIASCPNNYTCTSATVNCPSGWTCSSFTLPQPANPVSAPFNCPVGYSCQTSPGTPQNGNCPAGYVCDSTSSQSASASGPNTPVLGSISNYGSAGQMVAVSGSNFGTGTLVHINGNGINTYVTPTITNSFSLTFIVPSLPTGVMQYQISPGNLAPADDYMVQLSNGSNTSNTLDFMVIASQQSSSCPAGYTCSSPTGN